MAITTEVFDATRFMAKWYGPIADGMDSDTEEERLAEAADYAKNYKEEVLKTMVETKAMIEGDNYLRAKFQFICEIDKENLVFTINTTTK